jgi:hypothetical protein
MYVWSTSDDASVRARRSRTAVTRPLVVPRAYCAVLARARLALPTRRAVLARAARGKAR